MNKALVVGIGISVLLFIGLTEILPEARCTDGWLSDAIGRQGACSHHGGVDNNILYRLIILSTSIFVGYTVYKYFLKRSGRGSSSSSEIYAAGIDSSKNNKWGYLLVGVFFCSFILFKKEAYPVFILGLLFLIASIRELFRND